MGTRMAPAFANLFMGEFERKAIEIYVEKPFLWLRYVDDILMVWTHGNEKLINYTLTAIVYIYIQILEPLFSLYQVLALKKPINLPLNLP